MKRPTTTKYSLYFILIFSITILLSFNGRAQNDSVEESIFGVQTGLLGIWVHNETRLSDQLVLRIEIGLDAGLFGGILYEDGTGFIMAPVINLEPRWYYNLRKRNSRSRNTSDNAENFVALRTSYHPNLFVISNYDGLEVIDQISIVPTWGIRRNIGKHFNYEAGIGIGYGISFDKSVGFAENETGAVANLLLRIGYRF